MLINEFIARSAPTNVARVTLDDVGRDPWFLLAVQHPASTSMSSPSASNANLQPTANAGCNSGIPVTTCGVIGTHGQTMPVALSENSPSYSGYPPHTNAMQSPAATRCVAGAIAAPFEPEINAPSAAPSEAVPDPATTTTTSAHSADSTHWSREKITLQESANGIHIFARNYFVDAAERKNLVARARKLLQDAGTRPVQITLNGDTLWTAATTAGKHRDAR